MKKIILIFMLVVTGIIGYSMNIYAEESSGINPSEIKNIGSDYRQLPLTNEEFIDVIEFEEYHTQTHSFRFSIVYENILYKFNVAIPDELYNHNYDLTGKDQTISFINLKPNQISYATDNKGNRILYIQPDESIENYPLIYDGSDSTVIVGFSTINLTTMEYSIMNNLETIGVINKEENRNAILYCFFPSRIEELLSITVSYKYRTNYFFGIKGQWIETIETYVNGDKYEGVVPTWMWWIPGFGWGWVAGSAMTGNSIYDIDNVIETITQDDIPSTVKASYVNNLNGKYSDLDNLALYKVKLGQFQGGALTPFSDDNAYDIQDLVILELMYIYNGKVYKASEEIISIVKNPELSPGLNEMLGIETITETLNKFITWGSITIIILIVIMGITKIKNMNRNYRTYRNRR